MFLLFQLLFFVVVGKIVVIVLVTGGARSSTLRRTSTSRSSFPEKTQQPGKLIKKNTDKLLCSILEFIQFLKSWESKW